MRTRRYIRMLTDGTRKKAAIALAAIMLLDAVRPTCVFALTGGPSQPEVESFEPVSTSNMVDMFTGSFNYNIPLLDIDGYPVNISYHSGITMDQEASWVGLGWNISAGCINRAVRGLPDDFDGDQVTREFNKKENETYGMSLGVGLEFFGAEGSAFSASISYSIGVHYNNYTGYGADQSLNLGLTAGSKSGGKLSGGLGINSSSDNGLTVTPNIGFSEQMGDATKDENSGAFSIGIGCSYSSRSGLKSLTVNISGQFSHNPQIDNPPNQVATADGSDNSGDSKSGGSPYSLSEGVSGKFDLSTPTFTPEIDMAMVNFSLSGNFKIGGAIFGLHPNATAGLYYSNQSLLTNSTTTPAYGYMYLEQGYSQDEVSLDFNREKDGSFTPYTPELPVMNLTYDVYSVSGQGVGGSYRPFRSDVGYVHDRANGSYGVGGSGGLEIGLGDAFHAGGDITVSFNDSRSGQWSDDNLAASKVSFHTPNSGDQPTYETYFFREANDKGVDEDTALFNALGGYNPERFSLDEYSKFNTVLDPTLVDANGTHSLNFPTHRVRRAKRNNVIAPLTNGEMKNHMGIQDFPIGSFAGTGSASLAHLAQFSVTGTDGKRYVYGLPAYNTLQKEVSFAVGRDIGDDANSGRFPADIQNGLITYVPGDNSTGNQQGIDNFFSGNYLPPYAHSYLLTSVLSPDYVDADAVKGPSDGDLGSYVGFYYKHTPNYNWRTPVEQNMANYNEGLKTDDRDDKASYIYGTKELYYLDSVVTKNYIALFYTSLRHDAHAVLGENGGIDNTMGMQRLDSIALFDIRDYRKFVHAAIPAVPIKTVHFVYDYSLCGSVPNNDNQPALDANHVDQNTGHGKLTLKQIYFTYQYSNKEQFSPYVFTYSPFNPNYGHKSFDRWGDYKANAGANESVSDQLSTSEFPYVDQTNKAQQDQWMSAWTLSTVQLPSGGLISMQYESNDYGYVQNLQAGQMFKIIGTGSVTGINFTPDPPVPFGGDLNLTPNSGDNQALLFETTPGYGKNIAAYFNNIGYVYFRCLSEVLTGKDEYVSGYAKVQGTGTYVNGTDTMGWVQFNPAPLKKDLSGPTCNPITLAIIQFGRMYTPQTVWDQSPPIAEGAGFLQGTVDALCNSSFIKNIKQAIEGPNNALYIANVGHSIIAGKSWLRLNNVNGHKMGGGARVKQIATVDQWNGMTAGAESTFDYGQQFNYNNPDGTSSGVATYEPMVGNDENPFRQPIFYSEGNSLIPNSKFYMETPMGECFYPSPSVGYSRVTVQNIKRTGVHRHATGQVVHEFYTSKDFPTIPINTDLPQQHDKSDPFSLTSIFYVETRDYMTATEGYYVETNDMNGKEKKQSVYQEDQSTPITSVEYVYKQQPYMNGSFRLSNYVPAIDENGNVFNANLGTFYDMAADMRQETGSNVSVAPMINLDGFVWPFPPFFLAIPMILPNIADDETQFRSATTTKVVQRFGILEKTIAKDLGSTVETDDLAYDAETGNCLLTRTTTDYNDTVYSMMYPSHWFYDGMGPAYKNTGDYVGNLTFGPGGVAYYNYANSYFEPGDELEVNGNTLGWVTNATPNSVTVLNKDGSPMIANGPVKVLRSGRRNLSTTPIMKVTSLKNPLSTFKSNIFTNVLQASADEFANYSRTFCDCFGTTNTNDKPNTTNPYVLGIAGNWKKVRSLLYLTDRTQSNYNNNTNIRKDGQFSSFAPYFSYNGSAWALTEQNWTFTQQVTQFSPYGPELEDQDALGRYSAAQFGYKQTLPEGVASNSSYNEIGFDGFEDHDFSPCADNHFKFMSDNLTSYIDNTQFHTGYNSLLVKANNTVTLDKAIAPCASNPCNLSLNVVVATGTNVTIVNQQDPVSIQWNILNGNPKVVYITSDEININGSGKSWQAQIIVTDSKGCKVTQIVSGN